MKGGYRDSNPGPSEPQSDALTNCAIPTISVTIFLLCRISGNVLEGIRTPDPRLRRPLLYPAELRTHNVKTDKERVMGIEPTDPAWKAGVLPLNYTRTKIGVTGFEPATSWSQTRRSSQAEPHPVITYNVLALFIYQEMQCVRARDIILHFSSLVNTFFNFSIFYLSTSSLNTHTKFQSGTNPQTIQIISTRSETFLHQILLRYSIEKCASPFRSNSIII